MMKTRPRPRRGRRQQQPQHLLLPERIEKYHLVLTVFGGALVYCFIVCIFSFSLYQSSESLRTTAEQFDHPKAQNAHSIGSINAPAPAPAPDSLQVKPVGIYAIFPPVQHSNATKSDHKHKSLAIFYNVYVPETPKTYQQTAVDIIKEQVAQVADSYAGSLPNTTIYYNTIGSSALTDTGTMQDICSNHSLNCHHMQHYASAFEEVTLSRVYDYCQYHSAERVVYMHSKGTYHSDGGKNDKLRRHLTRAVTDKRCVHPADPSSCNLCGLVAGTFPIHMPGNFFVADCTYVKNLQSPTEFSGNMEVVTALAKQGIRHGQFQRTMFPDENWFYGTERYSAEHWIGSHPDVQMCDLSDRYITYWSRKDRLSSEMTFSAAPRNDIAAYVRDVSIPVETNIRMREYSLLPGLLLKWYHLYRRAPALDSWVWTFFPEGLAWREAVAKHGEKAIQALTTQYRPDPQPPSDLSLDVPAAADYSVFFNVVSWRAFEPQFHQLGGSYAATAARSENRTLTVFYGTVGSISSNNALNATYMDRLCAGNNLICRHLHHFNESKDEGTLQPLHQFCQLHPAQTVIYLHNYDVLLDDQPSLEQKNTRFRKFSQKAVTSRDCLRPTNDTCNVCGLFFEPWPVVSFPGNAFSAKCSYINRLMEPESFELNQPRLGALTSHSIERGVLAAAAAEPDSATLGYFQHSMEHWVGSHPSLLPCDMGMVAKKNYWGNKGRTTSEFEWSMAPRVADSSSLIPTDKSLRMRDFSLLPGLLSKWYYLYNEIPSGDSWVWSFYPDGKEWKQAIQMYGNRSVEEMIRKYRRDGITFEPILE